MRVRTILCAACVIALAPPVEAGGPDQAPSRTVTVVVEGPPGPYPKGHAEIIVTLYDAEAADKEPRSSVLATQSKRLPLLVLPERFEIDTDPERLSVAKAPAATAFITITRRPAYVSKTPTPLAAEGPTHVSVVAID